MGCWNLEQTPAVRASVIRGLKVDALTGDGVKEVSSLITKQQSLRIIQHDVVLDLVEKTKKEGKKKQPGGKHLRQRVAGRDPHD